jgi:hypothetical protein
MKMFDVMIADSKGTPFLQDKIEADSPEEAYRSFVNKSKPLPYGRVSVNWGMFGAEGFDPPHYEGHELIDDNKTAAESIREKRIAEEKERLTKIQNLSEKISSSGFNSLDSGEIMLLQQSMTSIFQSDYQSDEELSLLKASLGDESAYRYLSLRSETRSSLQQQAMLEAMNVNLSNISNKTSGVKVASMFTGMAAARHLGEEFAEDFGGGDE